MAAGRFGRRWPLFVFHLIVGVALFINIFVPEETGIVTNISSGFAFFWFTIQLACARQYFVLAWLVSS